MAPDDRQRQIVMKHWRVLPVVLFLVVAAGCASLAPTGVPTAPPAPTAAASATPVPTNTALPTMTPAPSSTPTPPPTATITPAPTAPPAVLIGAGDIAYCGPDNQGDEQTAALLARLLAKYPQAQIFAVGDTVQGEGLDWEYRDCFGPTWGRFLDRMHPVPGNHEYMTDGGRAVLRLFWRARRCARRRAITASTWAAGTSLRSTATATISPAARILRRRPGCAPTWRPTPRPAPCCTGITRAGVPAWPAAGRWWRAFWETAAQSGRRNCGQRGRPRLRALCPAGCSR